MSSASLSSLSQACAPHGSGTAVAEVVRRQQSCSSQMYRAYELGRGLSLSQSSVVNSETLAESGSLPTGFFQHVAWLLEF